MSAARLSEQTKREILAAYLAGDLVKHIAHRFGVDQSYPGLLAKRRSHATRSTRSDRGQPRRNTGAQP